MHTIDKIKNKKFFVEFPEFEFKYSIYDVDENEFSILLCEHLEKTGWKKIPYKREGVNVYQIEKNGELYQVNIPINKDFADYDNSMYGALQCVAKVEALN